jgi:hypothetical protein
MDSKYPPTGTWERLVPERKTSDSAAKPVSKPLSPKK